MLLETYQMFEDEKSTVTGLPLWLTRSIDPNIMFSVEDAEDRAIAALDVYDEKHSKDKKKGMTRWAVPIDADSNPLEYGGLTRHQFKAAAIQEQQDREEGIELERERPEGGYNPADYGDGLTTLP